jgi:hypothetical protein
MVSKSLLSIALSISLMLSLSLIVQETKAVPSFARKYKTSCTTCHYAFPKLNAFGKAFKNNGYRYPAGQDLEMTKEEPVNLGADAYKKVWPKAIWQTNIAGTVPFSAQAIGRIHFDNSVNDTKSAYFEIPHEFELFFAGTFDNKISYFGEVELEHASELAYEFSVNYDFNPWFHLKLGSVGLQHATPEHHRLTAEHYDVVDLKTQSGAWRLRNGAGAGIELWGAGNGSGGKGGFTYAVGVGNGQNDDDNFDLNKKKDYYGRVTYKIGGLGEIGGTTGQASEESAFYLDNSLRFGGFVYSGTAISGGENDKFSVIGGDIDWWFNRLNMTAVALQMKSDYMGTERTSLAYFIEGNYVIYPWLIARARYEYDDPDTNDDINEAAQNILPGMVVMVRSNVKFSLEYLKPLDDPRKANDKLTFQFNFAF